MRMKAQWDEGRGRILLGDNTGGGAVMLWPIRLRCAGVCGLSCRPVLSTYTADDVYPLYTPAQSCFCRTYRSVFIPITVSCNLEPCSLVATDVSKEPAFAAIKVHAARSSEMVAPSTRLHGIISSWLRT
jgi:hypothetical protein